MTEREREKVTEWYRESWIPKEYMTRFRGLKKNKEKNMWARDRKGEKEKKSENERERERIDTEKGIETYKDKEKKRDFYTRSTLYSNNFDIPKILN